MASMIQRMTGAATLNVQTYEDVEADVTATGQAAGVVVLAAVALAIGNAGRGGQGMISAAVMAILGWLIWSGVTYLIGERVFKGTATWGEMLRTIGFAHSPGVLSVFAFLPVIGWVVRAVVPLWMLIAGVIAIRQALDFDTPKAILTAVLGFLAIAIPRAIFF